MPQVKLIALPSVMSLFVQMGFRGQVLSTGTGFVVQSARGPLLVTNRHNVTGRDNTTNRPLSSTGGIPDEIVIAHNATQRMGVWLARREALYESDIPRWIEHPVLGPRADFVALPLTQLEGVKLYPYDVSDIPWNRDIAVGPAEPVSVIGFPFARAAGGFFAVWATGFVASEPDLDYEGLPILLIDCRSRPGQSGSPVIAYSGSGFTKRADGGISQYAGEVWRTIGVYSGRINKESDLGMVWKREAILELLDSLT